MIGHIRTAEKCPKCGGPFRKEPLACPACLTTPRRYFVDLSWPGQGRIKLYSGQDGHPLDSWERAHRLLTAIRYEIDRGVFDPKEYVKQELKTLRFENYAVAWLDRQAKRQERGDISRGYLAVARSIVNAYLMPHFGSRSIRDIREGQIEDFRERLPQNLKAKTVANILGVLNKIFRDAYRRRDIGYLPEFPKIPLGQPFISWIGEEDQEAVLAQVDNPIFKAFFLFLMKQGCRPGEARALRWNRVLFREGVVIIAAAMDQGIYREHTKERDVRVLPLHDEVREALESLPRSLSGFVFTHWGKLLSKKMVSGAWRQAAMKAGIDISCYEGTRHSLASQAVNNGVPLNLIGDFLGHKDRRSTDRYAHLRVETLTKVWGCPQTVRKDLQTKAKVFKLKEKKGGGHKFES